MHACMHGWMDGWMDVLKDMSTVRRYNGLPLHGQTPPRSLVAVVGAALPTLGARDLAGNLTCYIAL